VKRYECVTQTDHNGAPYSYAVMSESPYGEWVSYGDLLATRRALEELQRKHETCIVCKCSVIPNSYVRCHGCSESEAADIHEYGDPVPEPETGERR
jgi:hypothetical protein